MLKAAKLDLEDLCDSIEHLKSQLPRMTLGEYVDVDARLNSARKTLTEIDDFIKDEIKKKLKHRPGEVRGEVFKALFSIVSVTRLDQKALQEGEPETYERYCRRADQERVRFEPR